MEQINLRSRAFRLVVSKEPITNVCEGGGAAPWTALNVRTGWGGRERWRRWCDRQVRSVVRAYLTVFGEHTPTVPSSFQPSTQPDSLQSSNRWRYGTATQLWPLNHLGRRVRTPDREYCDSGTSLMTEEYWRRRDSAADLVGEVGIVAIDLQKERI